MRPNVKLIWLLAATALIAAVVVGCGGADAPETTQQPQPTAEPTSTPTPAPTPTASPQPMQSPTATPAPTATAESTSMIDNLPAECLPGGALDDAATIASCAAQAMQQVRSLSFSGVVNPLAIFSLAGSDEGRMEISADAVLPDRFSFTVSMAPEGETIEIRGTIIGDDFYAQDPELGLWFKIEEASPDSQPVDLEQIVGMARIPDGVHVTLGTTTDLEDRSRAYVLSYVQAEGAVEAEGLVLPSATVTLVVEADDFMIREVRVGVAGLGSVVSTIMTITYSGYNEPLSIEPPAQFQVVQ